MRGKGESFVFNSQGIVLWLNWAIVKPVISCGCIVLLSGGQMLTKQQLYVGASEGAKKTGVYSFGDSAEPSPGVKKANGLSHRWL